MPRNIVRFVIAPVLLATTCLHAQVQEEPSNRSRWDHNGSIIYLIANGPSREFFYEHPRPGMLDVGAKPGSLLFQGEAGDGQYSGTAYVFNRQCGRLPFHAKGPILEGGERILLTGQAPRVGRNCRTYSSYSTSLEFRLLKPVAAINPKIEPEIPLTARELLRSQLAIAQAKTFNETTLSSNDPTGSIPEVAAGTLPPKDRADNKLGEIEMHRYAYAGTVILVIGAFLFFFGRLFRRRQRSKAAE
jgi:hypothetical protein